MASKKQLTTTIRLFKRYEIKLTRRDSFLAIVGLLVLAVIVLWLAVTQIQRLIAIHQQQQRFDSIHSVQRSFETNVRQLLGPKLTDMKEYDSCYHTAQHEMRFPFTTNGVLTCGMEIQGSTFRLPNDSNNPLVSDSWNTMRHIAVVAKATMQQSRLAYTQWKSAQLPDYRNEYLGYSDSYNLYGDIVRCDLSGEMPATLPPDRAVVNVKQNQVYFTFNCYQDTSKNFFQFVPSPLDRY